MSTDGLDTALPRPGWRKQPHGWRQAAEELGYRAGGHSFAVRRAVCVDCWYVVIDADMVAGKHRTPQAAMEATECLAAQLARKARPARSRGRSGARGTTTPPTHPKPIGAAPMTPNARPIATVPYWSASKDIYLDTATTTELLVALYPLAQSFAVAHAYFAMARGLFKEIAPDCTPRASEITDIRRGQAAAIARGGELMYPLLRG
jgi:hypothetical protein